MEKTMGEEELKGLEGEIDAAVDRLFIEKNVGPIQTSRIKTPLPETFEEPKKPFQRESTSSKPISSPPPEMFEEPEKPFEWESNSPELISSSPLPETFEEPEKPFKWESNSQEPISPFPSSIEKLETQILSLEWEITKDSLQKTKEEVIALGKTQEESIELSSLLNRMVMVLDHMIKNKESIQPHLIKFLLDSKETVKLLMRKDRERDIDIYKKLAYSGIESRFFGLEELKESKAKLHSLSLERDKERTIVSPIGSEKLEKIASEMDQLQTKMDELMNKMTQHLEVHEHMNANPPEPLIMKKAMTAKVTVFKNGEKLFGVESDKVFRLFKVPDSLYERFIQLPKIRIKDLEAKIIDLKKFFPFFDQGQKKEKQILILRSNGEFKGVMIDRILKKLSAQLDKSEEAEEYLLGIVHWNVEGLPVEIPILDFKKF